MTKTAKTITYAAGIFTAFWLIIAFLITSVEAVAYWTPGYYEKEYTKYQRHCVELHSRNLTA